MRSATRADIPALVAMFREHHTEKAFQFPFNPARISMTLAAAIESPDALVLIADHGMLFATCFESPFGAGKLAVEHIIRGDLDTLLNAFESWARSKQCVEISLSCTDRYAAFARLYGRRGYALSESTFSKAL